MTRRGSRGVRVPAVVLILAVAAGCQRATPARTPSSLTVCGTRVATGARQAVLLRLQPGPSPTPPPARAALPPTASPGMPAAVSYIRTSDSCATGALVTVQPLRRAALVGTFRAADGRPAAIALLVTGPVVIHAWVAGRDQGSLNLD